MHENALFQNQFIQNPSLVGNFLDGRQSVKEVLKKNLKDRDATSTSTERKQQMKAYLDYSKKMGLTGDLPMDKSSHSNTVIDQ